MIDNVVTAESRIITETIVFEAREAISILGKIHQLKWVTEINSKSPIGIKNANTNRLRSLSSNNVKGRIAAVKNQ